MQGGDDPGRTRSRLLVSVPALEDHNFDQTVIYMIEHTDDGAIGVVLNRPSGVAVPAELDVNAAWASPHELFAGGPVSPEALIVLGRLRIGAEARGVAVIGGAVAVLAADAVTEGGVEGVDVARVFAGYAGWAPGQLEGELASGVWEVMDALPDDVFCAEPSRLWRSVLARQGGRLASMARYPDDPSAN
jgi:putative transcriptional regulator